MSTTKGIGSVPTAGSRVTVSELRTTRVTSGTSALSPFPNFGSSISIAKTSLKSTRSARSGIPARISSTVSPFPNFDFSWMDHADLMEDDEEYTREGPNEFWRLMSWFQTASVHRFFPEAS
ncbi:unnamed protein product [Calicophoron daubneyi]|uniref:Uncharacterized protein n=1 Tax=Calicophoron daubneyi TaxID=300641 RepID=A0AAV2SZW0_CALDB